MARFHEHVDQAKRYVRFCIQVYNHQLGNHRYFLHEHPWLATGWFMPERIKLEGNNGVLKVRTDMCQFGMVSRTAGIGSALGPVLKPKEFLTNCKQVARELLEICPRNHEHVPLLAGRAAAAAIYPHNLCCAICKGPAMQLQEDDGRRIDSPLLNTTCLKSLSYLCMEATGDILHDTRNDDYSSEHDATTSPTTMFSKYSSVGEQVVNFVQQTSGEVVQPNVLQTLTSSLCSVVNGSLNQACVNGDFDLNMIQMEVEGEEKPPTGRF
jgi:hypothetical protein